MKITFHGAAQNVTGSKHLIETESGFRLLLDCGFHQGRREEATALNREFPFDPASIDAVVLSHAHLDHIGLIPLLVKEGYKGPIYTTPATRDVAEHMLADSAHIQEYDAEYLNRHLAKGQEPIAPLYTDEDYKASLEQFVPIQYTRFILNEWTELAPGIRLKFYDAGHILGSAVVVLEITESRKKKHLAFTGDLGKKDAPILNDPEHIQEPIDILLSEATYGDRLHEPFAGVHKQVREVIEYAIKHKSVIVVPAFSLGRTQELIYILHQLFDTEGFPHIPVYLDSPLAIKITEVFKKHTENYDQKTREDFDIKKDLPLVFDCLSYTPTVEESKRLNAASGPFMVISASGMMEGGRVVHHLKNRIENPNTIIMITGYQAEHTLGRKILEGVSPVHIMNGTYHPRARIENIPALSAHADQAELLEYVASVQDLKDLFLVHGEIDAMEAFRDLVHEKLPHIQTHIPERGEIAEV